MPVGIVFRRFLNLRFASLAVNPRFYQSIFITLTFLLGVAVAWLPLKGAILLVGGVIFLVLLFINPAIGIYTLIPIIPFSSLLALPFGGAQVGLMEGVLLLALASGLIKIMTSRTLTGHDFKIKIGPLFWPFLFFISIMCLSWLNTFSIKASLVETIKWVEMLILYLLVINFIPAKHIKGAVFIIIFAGVAQALLGIYQFSFKVGPEGFLLFGGRFLRAYGTFAQPNPYAGYLGLVLPLSLSLTIRMISHNPIYIFEKETLTAAKPFFQRMMGLFPWLFKLSLYFGPLAIMLVALFASQSRGAWIGFVVASVVTVVVRSKKTVVALGVLIVIAAAIALIGSFELNLSSDENISEADGAYDIVLQRFADAVAIVTVTDVASTPVTDANFATLERLAHWQAAREMWRDNLWVGVGFGNYAAIYPAYAVGRWVDPLGHAHNYLLNLGAEIGLIGITTYLIFWIFVFGLLWVIVRHSNGFEKAVVAGSIGVMVHLHTHNMVDNLYVQGMYLHITIILGLISIVYLQICQTEKKP